MSKNTGLFDDVVSGAKSGDSKGMRKRGAGVIPSRQATMKSIVSGDKLEKNHYLVDPSICRMWSEHDRDYSLLNEHSCHDLIEGLKSQGQQEFPAIVRKLENDPEYEYEVICGARRHWTVSWLRDHNYPQFKFLVEVRDLTDEEAFRLSDIENRDKEDICDLERARKYARALGRYYKTQKDMAARLEVKEDWLSNYLLLAKLDQQIISAYPDIRDIRYSHAKTLLPMLKDNKIKNAVLKKARELTEDHRRLQDVDPDKLPKGRQIFKLLTDAAKPKKAASKNAHVLKVYPSKASNKDALEVSRKGRSGLNLRIIPGSGASKDELIALCNEALDSYFE